MILAGVDFSETSAHAVRHARDLADSLGEVVGVMHVREGFRHDAWVPDREEEAWLEALGLTVEDLLVQQGTAWIELVRVAREREARFIVVGTHGRTGFQPVQLGSTASRLALLSPQPVLLVGGRERAVAAPGARGLMTAKRP